MHNYLGEHFIKAVIGKLQLLMSWFVTGQRTGKLDANDINSLVWASRQSKHEGTTSVNSQEL
jgi:hypothetical protein